MDNFAAVLKYNPYHDERGRFTTSGGARTQSPYDKKRRGGSGPVKVEAKAKEQDEPKVTPKKVLESGPKKPVAKKPKVKEKPKVEEPKAKAPEPKVEPKVEAKPAAKPADGSDVTSTDPKVHAFVTAKTTAEIQAAMKELGWQDPSQHDWEQEGASRKYQQLESQNLRVAEAFRKKLMATLRKSPRGAATVKTFKGNVTTQEKAQELQNKANLLLHPKIAGLLSHPSVKVFSWGVDGGLASFDRKTNAIKLDTSGETKSEVDAIYVHEFGHKIETQVKGLLGTAKRLRSKYKREGREMVSDYAHREYSGNQGTEVISTGYEHYWRDPLSFADRAPEQFALIHGLVMRGEF